MEEMGRLGGDTCDSSGSSMTGRVLLKAHRAARKGRAYGRSLGANDKPKIGHCREDVGV